MSQNPIHPHRALYIKLGKNGIWEKDCIEKANCIRLGYDEVSHDLCISGKWDLVDMQLKSIRNNSGTATNDRNQIRSFYEADSKTLWITFFGDRLYWCFSRPEITLLPDGSKIRPVIDKWHSSNIKDEPLQKSLLSGKLLSMQGFRGTICSVKEVDYLLKKINCLLQKDVVDANKAKNEFERTIEILIHNLHWKDFEILIDLIFRQAGWQRVSLLGGSEKSLDLDLLSPITSERFGVQVKSTSTLSEFQDYQKQFGNMLAYKKFFFIVHTPSKDLASKSIEQLDNIELWLPKIVAHWTIKLGLADWVITKAS